MESKIRVSQPRSVSRLPVPNEGLNASPIFRLTRVTRIFQKKIFTETTPETTPAPGRYAAPGFLLRVAACAAARGGFLVFAEKTGKYRGDQSHAVSKGPKRKSGRTAARDRQSGDCARAESIVGTCRGNRPQGDRTRRRGRYGGYSRVHGAARAADQAPAGRRGAAAARKGGRQRRSDGEHRGCGRGGRPHRSRGRRIGQGRQCVRGGARQQSLRGAPERARERDQPHAGCAGACRRPRRHQGLRLAPRPPPDNWRTKLTKNRVRQPRTDLMGRRPRHTRRYRSQTQPLDRRGSAQANDTFARYYRANATSLLIAASPSWRHAKSRDRHEAGKVYPGTATR